MLMIRSYFQVQCRENKITIMYEQINFYLFNNFLQLEYQIRSLFCVLVQIYIQCFSYINQGLPVNQEETLLFKLGFLMFLFPDTHQAVTIIFLILVVSRNTSPQMLARGWYTHLDNISSGLYTLMEHQSKVDCCGSAGDLYP